MLVSESTHNQSGQTELQEMIHVLSKGSAVFWSTNSGVSCCCRLSSWVSISWSTLTLHIKLDLCLSAFDVKSVVRCSLAPVQSHHIPADVLKPQAAIRCLHHGLPWWHQQVLFCPWPQYRWTGFAICHQAHQLSVTSLSHTDHLTSWWNQQHWRRNWREGKGRERGKGILRKGLSFIFSLLCRLKQT